MCLWVQARERKITSMGRSKFGSMRGHSPGPGRRDRGPQRPSSSSEKTWFRTREGRRYGREIALIIVVKLMLLIVLWVVFIKPWPRAVTPPAAVVHQFYDPAVPAVRHD